MSAARLQSIRDFYYGQSDPGSIMYEAVNDYEGIWSWEGGPIAIVVGMGNVAAIKHAGQMHLLPWPLELHSDPLNGDVYAVRLED